MVVELADTTTSTTLLLLTCNDAQRDEEASQWGAETSSSSDSGGPSQEKHSRDQHVGQEAEEQEHQVRSLAPPGPHNLAYRVSCRSPALDLNRQDAEQQDLWEDGIVVGRAPSAQ